MCLGSRGGKVQTPGECHYWLWFTNEITPRPSHAQFKSHKPIKSSTNMALSAAAMSLPGKATSTFGLKLSTRWFARTSQDEASAGLWARPGHGPIQNMAAHFAWQADACQ